MLSLRRSSASGFSLIELVAVIVLLGIVAVGSSAFISSSVSIYSDTARRSELSQQGRYAVERISRELRDALPNSVRAGSTGSPATDYCLEFMPVLAASSYFNGIAGVSLSALDIVDQGGFPVGNVAAQNLYAVIFNADNNSPSDADGLSNSIYDAAPTVMTKVDAITDNGDTLNLSFAANHTFIEDSPQRRIYLIDLTAVTSFCARDNYLGRYSNYGMSVNQTFPPAGAGIAQVARAIRLNETNLVTSTSIPITVFEFSPGILNRSALVYLDLRFRDDNNVTEWSRFTQEVFLRNVP